jgi:hypothetical protein
LKQVLPHCWHLSFRSEAQIVTSAGDQAIVQIRKRYCHIDVTQASGQKQILSQPLALKQQFKSETGIATLLALKRQVRSRYWHNCWRSSNSFSRQKQVLPHCWYSSFRLEADIVKTAVAEASA